MRNFLLLVVGSFLSSFLFTPLIRWQAIRWRVFDHPDEDRRVHQTSLPRLGGVAIYLAVMLVWGVGSVLLGSVWFSLWKVLLPATLVFLLGVADDVFGVSERMKLIVPAVSAALLPVFGLRLTSLSLLPEVVIPIPGWLGFVLLVLWVVGVTNALNLIDGVDGLAVGISGIVSLALLLSASLFGPIEGVSLSLILLPALLGFLCYNYHPASIFLGDSGSLWLGFLLAVSVLFSTGAGNGTASVAAPVILGLPILEAVVTLLRRWRSRQPLLPGDRGHFHHKLLDRGLSQRQVVLRLYAVGAVFALIGLLLLKANWWQALVLYAGLLVGIGYGVGALQYAEFRRR